MSTCSAWDRPIPEVARLGRTLHKWKHASLAYFTTAHSSNAGTEAVNGILELHRRLARGYRNRDNYRLRILLAAGNSSRPIERRAPRSGDPNRMSEEPGSR